MSKTKLIEARVLVAIKEFRVEANHLLQGTEAHIKALEKAGLVDTTPEAVEYVKTIGSPVVAIPDAVAKSADAGDVIDDVVDGRKESQDGQAAADLEVAKAEGATEPVQTSAQAEGAASEAAGA